MFSTDFGIFIQLPDGSSKRVLHAARITGGSGSTHTAEFDETGLAPQAGQDILVFYERNRKFVQQVARLDAVLQTGPKPVIGFQLVGQPVSAESRQCYRVSTVNAGLAARLASEDGCPLQEVSATGFAVIAKSRHDIGNVLEAELRYQDKKFAGRASVQSIKELGPNRIRYGLHCIDDNKGGAALLKGVQHISIVVQQQQLRRRAGGA